VVKKVKFFLMRVKNQLTNADKIYYNIDKGNREMKINRYFYFGYYFKKPY